jgi:acetate kinase
MRFFAGTGPRLVKTRDAALSVDPITGPSIAPNCPPSMPRQILAVNAGSSTIKFAAFRLEGRLERVFAGSVPADDAARALLDRVAPAGPFHAIGHRVVHGGLKQNRHQPITSDLIRELCENRQLDLAHLPREIALIQAFLEHFSEVPQIACFDTVFHQTLPPIARMLPLPRRYYEAGIRRLGFHGLSYMWLSRELRRIAGDAGGGRAILAHLGSGSSMTAMRDGAPLDTSMAFTPTAGLVMGTRPGDLDPGLLVHLIRAEGMTPDQLDDFVSHRCGLAGVSESTSDMRELAARRDHDERARDAFDLYCYQARKWIGAYSAVLGGLDTLVFSGGIGEHSPEARAAICEGLEYLGIRLDPGRNAGNAAVISADPAVAVRIIPTDEEQMIAEIVRDLTV